MTAHPGYQSRPLGTPQPSPIAVADTVEGYLVPVDPMDELGCDACQ